jgi:hypothetical protein
VFYCTTVHREIHSFQVQLQIQDESRHANLNLGVVENGEGPRNQCPGNAGT